MPRTCTTCSHERAEEAYTNVCDPHFSASVDSPNVQNWWAAETRTPVTPLKVVPLLSRGVFSGAHIR
jgi:hypothetical protein